MSIPYIMQGKNITLVIDNQTFLVNESHQYYDDIVKHLKEQNWDELQKLVDIRKAISDYTSGDITIKRGKLYYKNEVVQNALVSRILEMLKDGFDAQPLINFLDNLMKNPSSRAVNELYRFLDCNRLPITPEGKFIAYKKVTKDYLDIHSKTILNKVGCIVIMDRNKVDDDYQNTCSTGLHFCSKEYLSHFGCHDDPVMIIEIDPADVVSIPRDYNNSKGRCCQYKVIGQLDVHPDDLEEKAIFEGYK